MSVTSSPLPAPRLPGVGFEAVRNYQPGTLRTDIALFIGRTERGPVGQAVRIDGMRTFQALFGNFTSDADCPLAVRGYFENGGRIAWVLRPDVSGTAASGVWHLAADGAFVPAGLGVDTLRFAASSPGRWGNDLIVLPTLQRGTGEPSLDLEIRQSGRLVERLSGLPLGSQEALEAALAERSAFVGLEPDPAAAATSSTGEGPARQAWPPVALVDGTEGSAPIGEAYEQAATAAMELDEPALIVLPDLYRDMADPSRAVETLLAFARQADRQLDRMVIADAPETVRDEASFDAWLALFQQDPAVHRALAAYHPWIQVHEPTGDVRNPLRKVPASGHVTGAIAGNDLARGAYVTPANLVLRDAVDTSRMMVPGSVEAMALGGLNQLQCQSGRGLVIWGGRMLRTDDAPVRFVAHRRFIQRLVRALRRTWAPLVFEPNNDGLRYAIARQATTLLLEAFQSGILKGNRPEEAFRVDVGDHLNDAAARDDGKVFCEISIAPAVPMEFIQIRIGLSLDGTVELIEP